MEEIEKLGYKVRAVTNAIHSLTKTPLPLFFIDLELNPENKTVFSIKTLYHSRKSLGLKSRINVQR
jgi:hypothetical protein